MKESNHGFLRGKITKHGGQYLLETEDGIEIKLTPSKAATAELNVLISAKKNLNMDLCFKGRFRTMRLPPYIEFTNAQIIEPEKYSDRFVIEGYVMRIYKNCISEYKQEYDYVLVKLENQGYLYKMKLNYTHLNDTKIKDKCCKFIVERIKDRLVIVDLIDISDS